MALTLWRCWISHKRETRLHSGLSCFLAKNGRVMAREGACSKSLRDKVHLQYHYVPQKAALRGGWESRKVSMMTMIAASLMWACAAQSGITKLTK